MQKALLPKAESGPRARGLPPRRVCPTHPDPGLVPPGRDGPPGGGLSNPLRSLRVWLPDLLAVSVGSPSIQTAVVFPPGLYFLDRVTMCQVYPP